jgi:hypothetical protein
MANFFNASARYSMARAVRAPEAERNFWNGRAAAALAAGTLKDFRAVEVILNLQKKHASNPTFTSLCETLTTF